MQIFDLFIQVVDNPEVIIDKDQIRLFDFRDLPDPLDAKGFRLKPIG